MECAWAKAKKELPDNASVDELLALQRFCDSCPKPEVCGVQDKKYNTVKNVAVIDKILKIGII